MPTVSRSLGALPPEQLLDRLLARLRNHVFWDCLSLCMPPLLVCAYGAIYLGRNNWISQHTLLATLLGVASLGVIAMLLRYRPLVPSLPAAAQKLDRLSGAKDHFVTIATIVPGSCSTELLSRLRGEAASLQAGIELKRDFPYRLQRSFYVSLAASLVVTALIHLLPAAYRVVRPVTMQEHLQDLAEKMAQRPNLKELAQQLQTLATKLADPEFTAPEQKSLIQESQKQIEQEQQKQQTQKQDQKQQEQAKQDSDLLGDASATLKSLEQQAGSGQEQQKDQNAGSGSLESNSPQDGKGESKPSSGSDGQGKEDLNATMSKDMEQGKSAQGDAKGDAQKAGGEKNQQSKGDAKKGNEPDPKQPGADKGDATKGKTQGGAEETGGKNTKTSEEVPQGAAPSDRMGAAGEGKGGLKNARYVTVRLPEDVAADTKGESVGTRDSKGNRVGAKLPGGNTPLPAHLPDAPAEKQQMPLEYRGIIR